MLPILANISAMELNKHTASKCERAVIHYYRSTKKEKNRTHHTQKNSSIMSLAVVFLCMCVVMDLSTLSASSWSFFFFSVLIQSIEWPSDMINLPKPKNDRRRKIQFTPEQTECEKQATILWIKQSSVMQKENRQGSTPVGFCRQQHDVLLCDGGCCCTFHAPHQTARVTEKAFKITFSDAFCVVFHASRLSCYGWRDRGKNHGFEIDSFKKESIFHSLKADTSTFSLSSVAFFVRLPFRSFLQVLKCSENGHHSILIHVPLTNSLMPV